MIDVWRLTNTGHNNPALLVLVKTRCGFRQHLLPVPLSFAFLLGVDVRTDDDELLRFARGRPVHSDRGRRTALALLNHLPTHITMVGARRQDASLPATETDRLRMDREYHLNHVGRQLHSVGGIPES